MRLIILLTTLIIIIIVTACSEGNSDPTSPPADSNIDLIIHQDEFTPVEASDILYSYASGETVAYKAFGIFQVIINPIELSVEIIPSRKAQAIGHTFDSDLTQFLTVSPCYNCLILDGIRFIEANKVEVGFAIKHPFGDITLRPDLHGFDVRGIVISEGNYDFPFTIVIENITNFQPAHTNVNIIDNPDGYTHHFDNLAADPNYFDPPLSYGGNLNPFKSYFVDGATGAFNPHEPSGHNVMATGADWETQYYIFNLESGTPLDFVFVVDCAYGQSATFQNRDNPYYFLPEFNRKEAWWIETNVVGGYFESGNTSSSMDFRVSVCDWQTVLAADPDYPDTGNLGGISEESDIASVSIDIPNVSTLVESTTPDSGEGMIWNPYVYNLTVTNSQGASAGNYYGIVAVRDDLHGQQGPIAIPETPAGFPYPGPEIYDYSLYDVFQVRVSGSSPNIDSFSTPTGVYEGDIVQMDVTTSEPDGDEVSYLWEQIEPVSPVGIFDDPTVEDSVWHAPPLHDVPLVGVEFQLRITASDIDGSTWNVITFNVQEKNSNPECLGIETDPYYGVFRIPDNIDFWVNAVDPDGDTLAYEWDPDWSGRPVDFNPVITGDRVDNYTWMDQGFYEVACRITENRANPLNTICSRLIIQEGLSNEVIKVDDSSDPDPGYHEPNVLLLFDSEDNPVYHVSYADMDSTDDLILYCNNAGDPMVFSNHQTIAQDIPDGYHYNSALTGQGDFIHVIWIDADNDPTPIVKRLMINSSIDGGQSFGAMGGERQILAVSDPDSIQDVDICAGIMPGQFFIFYLSKAGGNYYCTVIVSNDFGLTWSNPDPGTGNFRDNENTDYVIHPVIKMSANGVLHTLWMDSWYSPRRLLYDWSTDNGVTWNADITIADTPGVNRGSMAVDNVGNAFIVWEDNMDQAKYFRRSYYANPPTLVPYFSIWNVAVSYYSLDIWVSPDGNSIVVPMGYEDSGDFRNRYYYSFNGGISFSGYIDRLVGTDVTDNIVCDGRFLYNPDRMEIFSAWVDERTGTNPNAHIYGEYLYLAERF